MSSVKYKIEIELEMNILSSDDFESTIKSRLPKLKKAIKKDLIDCDFGKPNHIKVTEKEFTFN